jgi:Ras-related protein Rab-1A
MRLDLTPEYDYSLKFELLGDGSIGKSCLLLRFADNTYVEGYLSTIGMDFKIKKIESTNKKIVKLQVWDCAGRQGAGFKTNTSSNYFGEAHGTLAIYDITDQVTFNDAKSYIKDHLLSNPQRAIILVGAKCDLKSQRAVETDEAKKFADELGVPFVETSAKENINVDVPFYILVEKILEKFIADKIIAPQSNIGTFIPKENPKSIIEEFLRDLNAAKEELRKDCASTFTLSFDRKKLGYQALDALEKNIKQDSGAWRNLQDPRAYIAESIEKIKNSPQYIGVDGGAFNATKDLFSKYSNESNAQENSCNIM